MSFESHWTPDSSAPTFANMVNGQINLRDAVKRQIDFEAGGKAYRLSDEPAVLIVRYVTRLLCFGQSEPYLNYIPQSTRMAFRRASSDR